jgi:hypothetical protein
MSSEWNTNYPDFKLWSIGIANNRRPAGNKRPKIKIRTSSIKRTNIKRVDRRNYAMVCCINSISKFLEYHLYGDENSDRNPDFWQYELIKNVDWIVNYAPRLRMPKL